MKRLVFLGVASLPSGQMLLVAEATFAGRGRADCIAITRQSKPRVARWEMMKAHVPQAGAWEDLRFGIDSVAGRFVNILPNSFTDQTVMIEQELPVSGKNGSGARAATAEAGAMARRPELQKAEPR
jgi:hypothetical protein